MEIKGHIVDVKRRRIIDGVLLVSKGRIDSIRECGIPEDAPYILPGFVDSHVHIESSMMTPENFAAAAAAHGTVGAVCDPHEIANVLGLEGVGFMVDHSAKANFHFATGAPSCVPSTGFETSGAVLGPNEVEKLMNDPGITHLSEMMYAFGVVIGDEGVMSKIASAHKAGKPIDGHAPGLSGDELKKYAGAGISTDHECTTIEEAREKIALGMKILIREGSAAKNFDALSPLIDEAPGMVMFCTDDMHPDEFSKGHIDRLVRRSIEKGLDPWNVLRAACVNPVEHYKLDIGLLREGDSADFIVVRDNKVDATYIRGAKADTEGNLIEGSYPNNFKAEPISEEDIKVKAESGRIRLMLAADASLYTGRGEAEAKVEDGFAVADPERDILKMVVYNRYEKGAKPAVAFIRGFGLSRGALAQTIAHDCHNIVAVGASDEAIIEAINALVARKGGIVVADRDGVAARVELPVAGLISPKPLKEIASEFEAATKAASAFGSRLEAPFMTMGFMALPVIPEIKLTDKGLFDGATFNFTGIFI